MPPRSRFALGVTLTFVSACGSADNAPPLDPEAPDAMDPTQSPVDAPLDAEVPTCVLGGQTYACEVDAAYGSHPLQVYDFYAPLDAVDAPLVIYVHGGGYLQGDKSSAYTSPLFAPEYFLAAGYAYATINYRLSGEFPFVLGETGDYPVAMEDGARALQQLRARAASFGVDAQRVVLTGGSAGGGISMWLALHDDLGDGSASPSGQSTRVPCVALSNTQPTLDIGEVEALLGADGWRADEGITGLYGLTVEEYYAAPETHKLALADSFRVASPISHVSDDDSDLDVLLTYDLGPGEGNIHSPELGEYVASGTPTAVASAYGRRSLADIGVTTRLLIDQPIPAQRTAVRNFIANECFR